MLVEDALRGVEVVRGFEGPIVDVGSGNGSPGIPLAASLPEREVTLLEAIAARPSSSNARRRSSRTCASPGGARRSTADRYGVALAKALAPPAVALEWLLPLVEEGGAAVLWLASSVDLDALSRVSDQLGGAPIEELGGLAVARKIAPTPAGFPRRPGMARKRPLASPE